MNLSAQEVLKKNKALHKEFGSGVLHRALSATCMSSYDDHAAVHLYGFASPQHYHDYLNVPSLDYVATPLLLLQPTDDPLHQVQY